MWATISMIRHAQIVLQLALSLSQPLSYFSSGEVSMSHTEQQRTEVCNRQARTVGSLFFFNLNNCIVPLGFFPQMLLSLGKASSNCTQNMVHAGCSYISIFHRLLTWTTASLTCAQMLMHVIAHGSVWALTESLHWKLALGEKSLATPGNRTCLNGAPAWCSTSWATSSPWSPSKWLCSRAGSPSGGSIQMI